MKRLAGVTVFLFASAVAQQSFGQGAGVPAGSSGGQSGSSQATQLPLTGRNTQAGSVNSSEPPVAGTTSSINTLNPNVQATGAYAGSVPGTAKAPLNGPLTLRDAIQRGLAYNLGGLDLSQTVRQATGQMRTAHSMLMPNLSGNLSETVAQSDLKALGFHFNIPVPGISIPTVVGPYNYFQLQATLSQTVANLTELRNYKASQSTVKADQYVAQDARDLIVMGVGGAYLQVIAAKARLTAEQANLDTANTIYQHSLDQQSAGTNAQLDVDQNQIQTLTQQERLTILQNDLSRQKINLARMIGLTPSDGFDIGDDVPYAPLPTTSVEQALTQAYAQRADLKAAMAQVDAAQHARGAATAEKLPSASIDADYGLIGVNPGQSHGVFNVVGTVSIPLWMGGKAAGDLESADSVLAQRKAEAEDLRQQIEAEVREAFLDLQAAVTEVAVAEKNQQVAQEALDKTQARFQAGVINTLELVQAQETLSNAKLDYINSVFAHNVAKLTLARVTGNAASSLGNYLNMK